MWTFADEVWLALQGEPSELNDPDAPWLLDDVDPELLKLPITTIVCEDWRLYPDKLKALAWDQCRTARLIGALTAYTRIHRLNWHLQPASIKPEAQRAGCEELYYRPLHENRHQNDAIQHFVYFTTYGPDGSGRTPSNVSNKERDSS